MQQSTRANWILVLVTFVWGATFPIIYVAVKHIDGDAFVAIRFLLSALILLPFVFKEFRHSHPSLLWPCVILGLVNAVTYASQSVGLEYIAPTQSAFITGLNVVIVPFIAPLFRLSKLTVLDVVCALVCIVGLYLLTGANLSHLSFGEILTVICAIFYAISVVLLQIISKRSSHYKLVTFYQILSTSLWVLPLAASQNFHSLLMPQVLYPLLFCAIFATVLVLFLQVRYQQYTTANKAALIYSLEPVFACILSYFSLHTTFSKQMFVGAMVILFGTLLGDIKKFIVRSSNKRAISLS